jgi:dipeptidase
MSCTTLLVGKAATCDGSTIIARTEDSGTGEWCPKKFVVVEPSEQPRHYRSVLSHVELDLPSDPLRYSSTPEATDGHGIWAGAGINEANVAMNATETITSNPRVLAADPLVELRPAVGTPGEDGYQPEVPGGLGEEDLVTIVLPYIRSAREGVRRLGELLERYGTYEMNGIAFSDANEIWWLETIGGHHWIARRVPDDCYVTMPNQLGIDSFDLDDAEGKQHECMASADMRAFVEAHHLDLSFDGKLNPRDAFGSHTDADHVYNTPRAWMMQRWLNPRTCNWDGPAPDYTPTSDDIPWARRPERKITMQDVKDVLSLHYQSTPYDPYGNAAEHGIYRPIGINRQSETSALQVFDEGARSLQWLAFGSNIFNVQVPLFAQVRTTPDYLSCTTGRVDSNAFYWANRLIAVMADAHFKSCLAHIERYQESATSQAMAIIQRADATTIEGREAANEQIAAMLREQTDTLMGDVLKTASENMTCSYLRDDA